MINNKLLTAEEVAGYFGLKVSRIRSMVFYKQIPIIKIGRLVRFEKDQIDEWYEKIKKGEVVLIYKRETKGVINESQD